jgi:hypothetical protein
VAAHAAGHSVEAIRQAFRVSRTSVARVLSHPANGHGQP